MGDQISRKDFLKRVSVVGGALTVAAVAVQGCGGGGSGAKADPCTDVSAIPAADQQMRTTLQYVTATADPNKMCSNCQLYKAPEAGAACGGCSLFPGPVTAKGYCMSWVAKMG